MVRHRSILGALDIVHREIVQVAGGLLSFGVFVGVVGHRSSFGTLDIVHLGIDQLAAAAAARACLGVCRCLSS